jgi:hypothetical protein
MSDNLRLSAAKVSDVATDYDDTSVAVVPLRPTIIGPESISRLNRRCR